MPPNPAQPPGHADEPFSDASSAYWPPGWSWARYSSPAADFSALSEEEKDKMRTGLHAVLGDDGMRCLSLHLRRQARAREDAQLRAQGVPPPAYDAPDFLKQWRNRHDGGAWGFVGFRTTLYGDEERWGEFTRRVRRGLDVAFDRVVEQHRGHEYDEVARGRGSFEIRWVEDAALAGASAEALRARYAEVKKTDTAAGMACGMFLCASPAAVESVLSLDDARLPTTESTFWRDSAPFLLAVMEEAAVNPHGDEEGECDPDDANDERNWYKSVFKVPMEIIADELWGVLECGAVEPARLTRGVRGSAELGGTVKENYMVDGLTELWWGMGPSPRALARRRALRGF